MSGMDIPKFCTPADEVIYWKKRSLEHDKLLRETREELEEFQTSSRELEAELEAQLEQQEMRSSDLRHQLNQVATENQMLKERVAKDQHEFTQSVTKMQEEIQDFKSTKDKLIKYVRELEQSNDDLERAKRATVTSLEDFEARLNLSIERNAFLESELDEKESLKVMVQRLKDEARDLRQEVIVQKHNENSIPDNEVALRQSQHNLKRHKSDVSVKQEVQSPTNNQMVTTTTSLIDSNNKLIKNIKGDFITNMKEDYPINNIKSDFITNMKEEFTVVNNKGSNNHLNHHSNNGNVPLMPSGKISALNIVGDLLRKVGALESRLDSCRILVKESQRPLSLPPQGKHSAR